MQEQLQKELNFLADHKGPWETSDLVFLEKPKVIGTYVCGRTDFPPGFSDPKEDDWLRTFYLHADGRWRRYAHYFASKEAATNMLMNGVPESWEDVYD